MQLRKQVVEGVPFAIEPAMREPLRATLFRLRREMRLRFAPLREDEAGFTIWNIIGSIDLGSVILEVTPKTEPGNDWVASVLSLLVGSDAVDAAGERAAGQSPARPDLIEALGAAYAARLNRALRRDGPIAIMSRQRRVNQTLRGKLLVTEWVRTAFRDPARFPQEFGVLTTDNDFSIALAFVAERFAKVVRQQRTRASLIEAIELLRPGLTRPSSVTPGVELRQVPPQWSVYRPAWAIASAILGRRSLLGPQGIQAGVSIAIEPWPLLERLLERSLETAADLGRREGRPLSSDVQTERVILARAGGSAHADHSLRPDGVLLENRLPIATFEAKYRLYVPSEGPLRSEIYQALTAARALSSPLAVLVYPGKFETGFWRVKTPGDAPAALAAVGLDMFGFRAGDVMRANLLLDLVRSGLPREQNEIMILQ